jgi:LuxR family maltose regulon positive regulatory protein
LRHERQLTPGTPETLDYYQARLWLAWGDLASADQWAASSGLTRASRCHYLNHRLFLVLAQVHLAGGRSAEALAVLARLRQWAEAQALRAVLIASGACECRVLAVQGQTPAALDRLERTLRLAAPEGYVRTFVDEGQALRDLVAELRGRQRARSEATEAFPAYLDHLLEAFPSAGVPPRPTQTPALIENLSERELELLRLLAEGLSNREIAERLVITEGTVKAHTSNIYRKLDVRTRTQAVARGRALRLLHE